jgi:tripartite-type tricarboxylate transporter receptor subunit TctC
MEKKMFKYSRIFQTIMVSACVLGPALASDAYPSRLIKIVVATAAGGSSDVTARILANAIQGELKQQVIVENKVGASGTIGAAYVAKAAPDGYTLFFGTGSTHVVAPAMMKGIPYDPVKDFTPITLVGRAPFVLFAGPSLQARTLAEVVAAARARPGALNFGTTGPAAVYELAALTLESIANVQFNHVPYKGFGPMGLDVAGGRIDVSVGPVDGFLKSDKIHVIAALGSKRIAALPNAPTAAEGGYPGFNVPAWAAIWAPAETPRPIVVQLMTALRNAMARKDIQNKIAATGIDVEGTDDVTLRRTVSEEFETVKAMMRKAKVEPQ